MDGLKRRWGLVVSAAVVVSAGLLAQLVLATFTTGTTVVADPSETAHLELTLDAGGTARLSAAVTAMLPGDVRESLVVIAPAAGSAELGDLTYQVAGALVSDETPIGDDASRTNVLAEPATRGLAVEVRRCENDSTFRVRTVDTPVVGAVDVYCDRDAAGTPGAYDDADSDGTLVGAVIDPADGSPQPTVPLTLATGPVGAEGAPFNIRVQFVDNGLQNDLQRETFTLAHMFAAGPARAAGNT